MSRLVDSRRVLLLCNSSVRWSIGRFDVVENELLAAIWACHHGSHLVPHRVVVTNLTRGPVVLACSCVYKGAGRAGIAWVWCSHGWEKSGEDLCERESAHWEACADNGDVMLDDGPSGRSYIPFGCVSFAIQIRCSEERRYSQVGSGVFEVVFRVVILNMLVIVTLFEG